MSVHTRVSIPPVKTAPIFKYHGLGNDFVVVREADMPAELDFSAAGWAEALCDRHRGAGADGVLLLQDSGADADARMVIYNRDGSRPEMCGNGVRCVVRHLVQIEGVAPESVSVLSDAGLRRCEVTDSEEGTWQVRVEMGQAAIADEPVGVEIGEFRADLMTVDMGNPHAVAFQTASTQTIDEVGDALNTGHPSFPNGVNVEFVEHVGPNRLSVDVFERGVGRTMACGTGACAAAAAAVAAGLCDSAEPVEVALPGGVLRIEISESGVWMTGPVDFVFHGEVSSDWLESQLVTITELTSNDAPHGF